MPKAKPNINLNERTFKSLVTRCATRSEEVTKRFREVMDNYHGGEYPKAVSSLIENINNLYYSSYSASVVTFTEESSKVTEHLKAVTSARRALKKNPESADLNSDVEIKTNELNETLTNQSSSIRRSAEVLNTNIKNLNDAIDELNRVTENLKNGNENTAGDNQQKNSGTGIVVYNEKPLDLQNAGTKFIWVNPKQILPEEVQNNEQEQSKEQPQNIEPERNLPAELNNEPIEVEDTSLGIKPDNTQENNENNIQNNNNDDGNASNNGDAGADNNTTNSTNNDASAGSNVNNDNTTTENLNNNPNNTNKEKANNKDDNKSDKDSKKGDTKDDKKDDKKADLKQVPLVTASVFFIIAVACFFLLLAGVASPVIAPLFFSSAFIASLGETFGTLHYSEQLKKEKKNEENKNNKKENNKEKNKNKTKEKTNSKEQNKEQNKNNNNENTAQTEQTANNVNSNKNNSMATDSQTQEETVAKLVSNNQINNLKAAINSELDTRTDHDKMDENRAALNGIAQATQEIVPEGTSTTDFASEYQDLAQKCINFQAQYQVYQSAENAVANASKEFYEAQDTLNTKDSTKNQKRFSDAQNKLDELSKVLEKCVEPLVKSIDELNESAKLFEHQQENNTNEENLENQNQNEAGLATFARKKAKEHSNNTNTNTEPAPKPTKPAQIERKGNLAKPNTSGKDALVNQMNKMLEDAKTNGFKSREQLFDVIKDIKSIADIMANGATSAEQAEIISKANEIDKSAQNMKKYAKQLQEIDNNISNLSENNENHKNDEEISKLNSTYTKIKDDLSYEIDNVKTLFGILYKETSLYQSASQENEM